MVLFILLVVSQSVFSVHFCLLIYFYREGFALYMGPMGSLGNWGLCPIYQGATNLWGYMLNSTIWVWVPFLFFFFFFFFFPFLLLLLLPWCPWEIPRLLDHIWRKPEAYSELWCLFVWNSVSGRGKAELVKQFSKLW